MTVQTLFHSYREMDPVATTVLSVWLTITMLMHSIFYCENDIEESTTLEFQESEGTEMIE